MFAIKINLINFTCSSFSVSLMWDSHFRQDTLPRFMNEMGVLLTHWKESCILWGGHDMTVFHSFLNFILRMSIFLSFVDLRYAMHGRIYSVVRLTVSKVIEIWQESMCKSWVLCHALWPLANKSMTVLSVSWQFTITSVLFEVTTSFVCLDKMKQNEKRWSKPASVTLVSLMLVSAAAQVGISFFVQSSLTAGIFSGDGGLTAVKVKFSYVRLGDVFAWLVTVRF